MKIRKASLALSALLLIAGISNASGPTCSRTAKICRDRISAIQKAYNRAVDRFDATGHGWEAVVRLSELLRDTTIKCHEKVAAACG